MPFDSMEMIAKIVLAAGGIIIGIVTIVTIIELFLERK